MCLRRVFVHFPRRLLKASDAEMVMYRHHRISRSQIHAHILCATCRNLIFQIVKLQTNRANTPWVSVCVSARIDWERSFPIWFVCEDKIQINKKSHSNVWCIFSILILINRARYVWRMHEFSASEVRYVAKSIRYSEIGSSAQAHTHAIKIINKEKEKKQINIVSGARIPQLDRLMFVEFCFRMRAAIKQFCFWFLLLLNLSIDSNR